MRYGVTVADGAVVNALLHQPLQQCLFRGVTNVVCRRGVQCYGLEELLMSLSLLGEDGGGCHCHLVLRQRASLVGTNHRYCSHRLAGVELTHQVVALQHTTHIQRQRQCHRHRESFGYRHDYQCHRHHEVFQHYLRHKEIVVGVPHCIVRENVVNEEDDEGSDGYSRTYLTDNLRQTVQLYVQRSLHLCCLRRCYRHLANLGVVADSCYHEYSTAVHHHRRAQHHILGISLLPSGRLGGGYFLLRQQLSRQRRLVNLQTVALNEFAVRRYLVASLYYYVVANDDLTTGHQTDRSVPYRLHHSVVVHRCQRRKLLCRVAFKKKTNGGSKEDSYYYSQGLNVVVLNRRNDKRECGSHKEYLDNRVFVFLQIKFPQRCTRGGREDVLAILCPAAFHFS